AAPVEVGGVQPLEDKGPHLLLGEHLTGPADLGGRRGRPGVGPVLGRGVTPMSAYTHAIYGQVADRLPKDDYRPRAVFELWAGPGSAPGGCPRPPGSAG